MISQLAAWTLLAGSLIGAAFTANALWPRRSARSLIVSFAASMITIELAGHHLIWQGAAAAALVALGALEHDAGKAGLVVGAVSWAVLAWMLVRGRGARRTIHSALSSYVRDWNGPRIPRAMVLMPFPLRPRGVQIDRNVVYRRVAGRRLKLDVYRPAEDAAGRPAVIQIHGGAWIVGDKREQGVPLCTHLAASGWVAFNVNYRLSPGATFPDHLIDLKCALAWVREHAEEYGVDPSFIAVTGGSAGGHLTAMLALTQNDPRYQPGFEEADTSVQAAVPFYGVYDFTNRYGTFPKVFVHRLLQAHVIKARLDEEPERFQEASPIDQVKKDAPPFFVIHGDHDTLAPLHDARMFAAALADVSDSAVYFAEIRGAQHAFDMLISPRSAPVIEGVERFLDEALRRAREKGQTVADRAAEPDRAEPDRAEPITADSFRA